MTWKWRASAGISMRQAYQVWGPAVYQQQRRALASGDRVLTQFTGVDVPAGERADEPGWEVRRCGDGAGALGAGQASGG